MSLLRKLSRRLPQHNKLLASRSCASSSAASTKPSSASSSTFESQSASEKLSDGPESLTVVENDVSSSQSADLAANARRENRKLVFNPQAGLPFKIVPQDDEGPPKLKFGNKMDADFDAAAQLKKNSIKKIFGYCENLRSFRKNLVYN